MRISFLIRAVLMTSSFHQLGVAFSLKLIMITHARSFVTLQSPTNYALVWSLEFHTLDFGDPVFGPSCICGDDLDESAVSKSSRV
jgi:hypothetical protein